MLIKRKIDGPDEWTNVRLHGALDFDHSVSVLKLLLENVRTRGRVLVDLSAVTHIDSSGVASFVTAYRTAKQNGTRFGLAGVNPRVMRMLKLYRLDKTLLIHESGTDRPNELSRTRPQIHLGPRQGDHDPASRPSFQAPASILRSGPSG